MPTRGKSGRFQPKKAAAAEAPAPVQAPAPAPPATVDEQKPAHPPAEKREYDFSVPVDMARDVGFGIRDVFDRVNGYLLDVLRANEELTRQSVVSQIRIERERTLQNEFLSRKEEEEALLAREKAKTDQLRVEIDSLTNERESTEKTRHDLQSELSGLKSTIATLQAKNDGLDREVERLKERKDHLDRDVTRLEKLRDEYLETIQKIMARKEALSV